MGDRSVERHRWPVYAGDGIMTGLEDILPEDKIVHWSELRCPNCESLNIIEVNNNMASCKNDDCPVYSFSPIMVQT